MNAWKPLALLTTSAMVMMIGFEVACAAAPPNPAPASVSERQPHMEAALTALRTARAELNQAEHDKGGWRAAAVRGTQTAIDETLRGINYDNNH